MLALLLVVGCQGADGFARFHGELEGTVERQDGMYGCLYLKADDGYIYDFHFLQASEVFEQAGVVIDLNGATVLSPGDRVEVSGEIVHHSIQGPTVAAPVAGPAGCLSWVIEVEAIAPAP